MPVVSVNVWRPRPGRAAAFLSNIVEAKKIHERLGGRVRVIQTQFGSRALTISYVIEVDDMLKFGEFSSKLQSDSAWLSFWAKAQTDPSADLVDASLGQDAPLP